MAEVYTHLTFGLTAELTDGVWQQAGDPFIAYRWTDSALCPSDATAWYSYSGEEWIVNAYGLSIQEAAKVLGEAIEELGPYDTPVYPDPNATRRLSKVRKARRERQGCSASVPDVESFVSEVASA